MQKQRCFFREFRSGAPWLLIAVLAFFGPSAASRSREDKRSPPPCWET